MTKFTDYGLMAQVQVGTSGFSSNPLEKTLTFFGLAGAGTVGAIRLFNVTGLNKVRLLATCDTTLTSATGTVAVTATGSALPLLISTAASIIPSNGIWTSATVSTPALINSSFTEFIINDAPIVLTIGTANVTGGVLKFHLTVQPMSSDAKVEVA